MCVACLTELLRKGKQLQSGLGSEGEALNKTAHHILLSHTTFRHAKIRRASNVKTAVANSFRLVFHAPQSSYLFIYLCFVSFHVLGEVISICSTLPNSNTNNNLFRFLSHCYCLLTHTSFLSLC